MRRVLQSIAAVAALTVAASCGDPPDKELQQARSAIESARGAGAEVYARDEFSAAETALKNATEAVDQRDYRLALNRALDARERAQNAEKEAASRKAAARTEASMVENRCWGAAGIMRLRVRDFEGRVKRAYFHAPFACIAARQANTSAGPSVVPGPG